jgi:replication factor A1
MVQIASKYDIEPIRLVEAFRSAWENSTACCGRLRISSHQTSSETAMFRITNEANVIWQYPVNIGSITHPGAGDVIQGLIETTFASRSLPANAHHCSSKIGTLISGMEDLTIHGHLTAIPPRRAVMTRWGEQACVSNATIADETGSVRLSLWNNQITKFHVGDEVEIQNCYVTRFAGELQVRVKRKGLISISPSVEQDVEVLTPLSQLAN